MLCFQLLSFASLVSGISLASILGNIPGFTIYLLL